MKLAVIGSRDFTNYQLLKRYLDEFQKEYPFDTIISGGARGADSLAEKYAKANNLAFFSYLAEWEMYGARAGFVRNKEIIRNADMIIAFWDGTSRGTLHSIKLAEKQRKKHIVIYYSKIDSDLF